MDKELQDLTWSVLSKEFKKEVKNKWGDTDCGSFAEELLESIFGLGNLISDADGEEMLTVPRSVIIDRYHALTHPEDEYDSPHRRANIFLLQQLFGSKCLPDNVDSLSQNLPENCNNENLISVDDSKTAELKYHKGEKVRYNGYVYEVEGLVGKNRYALKGLNFDLDEDLIEPYTEPSEAASPNVNHSDIDIDELVANGCVPDPANHFDNILKRGFRDHNRLHIAAMALQGILANSHPKMVDMNIERVVDLAILTADTLIAECERTDKLKGERNLPSS